MEVLLGIIERLHKGVDLLLGMMERLREGVDVLLGMMERLHKGVDFEDSFEGSKRRWLTDCRWK